MVSGYQSNIKVRGSPSHCIFLHKEVKCWSYATAEIAHNIIRSPHNHESQRRRRCLWFIAPLHVALYGTRVCSASVTCVFMARRTSEFAAPNLWRALRRKVCVCLVHVDCVCQQLWLSFVLCFFAAFRVFALCILVVCNTYFITSLPVSFLHFHVTSVL